jgi:hypothetical protein
MNDEAILIHALNACEELRQALREIDTSVRAARQPIDDGELDFVTVRGELQDMDYYLTQARFAAGSMRDAVVDLVALVRRLQQAYHALYQAWQSAQTQVQSTEPLRQRLATLDAASLEMLRRIAAGLGNAEDGRVFYQELEELIAKYQA